MRLLLPDRKKAIRATAICGTVLAITLFAIGAHIMGFRLNISDSHVPAGIWRADEYAPLHIEVGDVISFRVSDLYALYPERTDTVIYRHPLIKIVAGTTGSLVERSGDTLIIDGRPYLATAMAPPHYDGTDPCKVEYPHVVAEDHVWVMNDSRNSYDSRYFGDVPREIVKEKLRPVWIWGL